MDIISKAANKKMLLTHVPTCNFHMQLVRYLSDVQECQGLTQNRFMWIFTFCALALTPACTNLSMLKQLYVTYISTLGMRKFGDLSK